MGDSDIRQGPTVRHSDRRTSDRECWTLLSQRQQGGLPLATSQLSQGNLRPDGRVLEQKRGVSTHIPRSPHVPSEEEHGVQPKG